MFSKTALVVCIQVFFVQSILSQCWNHPKLTPHNYGKASAYNGLASPFEYNAIPSWTEMLSRIELIPTSGGELSVTSGSAIAPTGVSIVSDNIYEGILSVAGELPFVGTTIVDGVLPSLGAGVIKHACGNGFTDLTAFGLGSAPTLITGSEYIAPYGVAPFTPLTSGFITPGLATRIYAATTGLEPSGIAATAYAAATHVAPTLPCDEGFLDAPYDIEFTATKGGALPVASGSAVPPTGLTVASETMFEGILAAAGELPFVGTVGLEGVLPTAGASAVNHACGNGVNTMVNNNAFVPGSTSAACAPASTFASSVPGYRAGCAGKPYGCAL